jgi:beta-fructofuranosidase
MYAGSGFKDWEIGDVEVHVHNGIYHLFHLIIPNHDYIAHAISKDGITWSRVNNALFVGHPGSWDDDMLWTMDVANRKDGSFEMFYTGLQLEDKGVIQRIGKAISRDLIDWEKVDRKDFIVESEAPHYESLTNNPREWLSFRDPFKISYNGDNYLLICARAPEGPTSRRGCVGLYKENAEGKYEPQKTILYPRVYDDIECPCIVEKGGRFYLIGSLREDVKVRYWYSDKFDGPYHSFHHDVFMPQGNYAARIVEDGEHTLVYNFYYQNRQVNSKRLLPPPKELDVDEKGRLRLISFYRWDEKVKEVIPQEKFPEIKKTFQNPTSETKDQDGKLWFGSKSGYELFTFEKPSESFIWEGRLKMEGLGKGGLLLNADEEGNGYYISLDFMSGYVQIRAWGFNEEDNMNNFVFQNLQTNQFSIASDQFHIDYKLICYGHYIELSINGVVKLTLIDYKYTGNRIGVYSASSIVSIEHSVIKTMSSPDQEYASENQPML